LVWLLVLLVCGGLFVSTLVHEPPGGVTEQERSVRNIAAEPGKPSAETQQEDKDWLIIPGKSFGKVTATTTREELDKLYGKENVKDEELHVGEGFYEKGTVLFPSDKLKRAEIFWQENQFGHKISLIRLNEEKSLWHTPEGITIGTPMKTLEKLNGGPFEMSGFGWDYGGNANIGSDKPGPLQGISVRLTEGNYEDLEKKLTAKEIGSVQGDKIILTSDPVLQKINPVTYQVFISLD
jgi:hypothetical protein